MNSCEEIESNDEAAEEPTVDLKSQDPYLRHSPGDVEIPNRIFVKGFSKETTEDDLINFFEIYGIVIEANIIRDKQGLSKGYGFVTFDSQTIAESVKLEGTVPFKDREVIIGHAKIRPIKFKNVDQYNSGCWYIQPQQPAYYTPDGVNFYLLQQQPSSSHYQQPVSFMTSPSPALYPAEVLFYFYTDILSKEDFYYYLIQFNLRTYCSISKTSSVIYSGLIIFIENCIIFVINKCLIFDFHHYLS